MNVNVNETVESFRVGVDGSKKRKWYSLIDKIWAMPNLEKVFKEVRTNRGAAV